MLTRIICPATRKNLPNTKCNRYLGEVEGHYVFKCDRCKAVIEGNTTEGWMKIAHPPQR